MFAERSARVLYAVGSGLHELQHALDGIADLHQRLDVFVLHAGCGRSEYHGLGTHGASEPDADPVFRDGEQDVHRDGICKEPALFQPDNKYRCIGAGITGIQLKIKVAVLCVFRLYALQLFLRKLKLGHVLQAGGCGVHTQQACQLGLRVPYLCDLGVSCIYLNPIFEAHANHRYTTANYLKADPLLGTNEEFAALCAAAAKEGIRIILDGVFSHTGSDSVYFNREGRYGPGGAYRDRNSPYRSWYDFDSGYPSGYRCWWGFETLPEVQEDSPSYIDFVCGKGGVIDTWLGLGASGFRLDVADELPDAFIERIRQAVKAHGEDKLLIGEVWEDATTKEAFGRRRTYLRGKGLDAVMNYPFRTALIAYLRGGDADDFRETLEALRENYPPEAFLSLMNFLGTHDTPRILTVLGADNVPDSKADRAAYCLSPAQRQIGLERLRLAALILFTFPGAPTVYYGDEAAMEGWEDPFNRAGYPWAQEDTDLKAHFAELARFRRSFPALQAGVLHWIWTSGPLLIFARELDGQLLTTVVNAADVSQALSLPWSAPPARDLLTGQRFIPTDNAIPLTLPPRSGWLLQTDLP
mgnify:CR=1 FL=1